MAKVLPVGTGALLRCIAGWLRRLHRSGRAARRHRRPAPIPDGKNVDYASRMPRSLLTHAATTCTPTILLGVGIVLARLRDLDLLTRGVRLIFQPAEETSPAEPSTRSRVVCCTT